MRIACLALALLFATPALADPKREARALLREGNRLLDQRDWAGALELYRSAYARYPSAKILLNLGTALRQLGREAEAADAYDSYLRDPKADRRTRAEVESILADLETRVARLVVHVDEPGAEVRLDGQVVGTAPVRLHVEAGTHDVGAHKDGFPAASSTIATSPGDERSIELRLHADAGIAATTTPPVRRLDSQPLLHRSDAAPSAEPTVTEGTVVAPAPPRRGPPAWSPWLAMGVAAAAAGAGTYFGLQTMDESADVDSRDSAAKRATIAFAVAGAAAAGGVGLWIWRWSLDDTTHARMGVRSDGTLWAHMGF